MRRSICCSVSGITPALVVAEGLSRCPRLDESLMMSEQTLAAQPHPLAVVVREALYVPDRFEALRRAGPDSLRSVVYPVQTALAAIDQRFTEMRAARRGALTILRGETGAGKSTFLDTVGFFRDGVVTERIPSAAEIAPTLMALGLAEGPRIVVLEGREALRREADKTIEQVLHAVNEFVRAGAGENTLVVWPTNSDELTELLIAVASRLGGEALVGVGKPVEQFSGPPREAFAQIAEQTVQTLNNGASLAALGISRDHAHAMVGEAATIGHYLALVTSALLANGAHVEGLLELERYRLWAVVIAGNDPENDVAAVTRGSQGYADIDRLLVATEANVVKELKRYPERLGLLGTTLDARILHMDMLTALAVARAYGSATLHALMRQAGMATSPSAGESASSRLGSTELGRLLAANALGTRRRGSRPGGGTRSAFASLAGIARANDGAINRAIGEGLKQARLIDSYETEKEVGTDLKFSSDLWVSRAGEPIRLEVMWRRTTSRAEIANYVLVKLRNYGRAIGYLA